MAREVSGMGHAPQEVMTDEHLRRSIRAISTLHYFISVLALAGSSVPLLWLAPPQQVSVRYAAMLAIGGVAVFLFLLARSLRQFRPWARTGAMVISCIGLVVFPLGTAIFGPFLYVLVKAKHLFGHTVQRPAAGIEVVEA